MFVYLRIYSSFLTHENVITSFSSSFDLIYRYEAAQVLKKECLKEFTLGDILQILNITATTKKWITHHQTGWKPITISLAAETTNETATEADPGIQTVA
jgi:hypothetical protein